MEDLLSSAGQAPIPADDLKLLIAEQEASGLSIAAFARERGINA